MNTILIGIAGGTGSGKTTLTRHLKEHFGKDVTVMAYIMTGELWRDPAIPSPAYYGGILEGYRQNGLPVQELKKAWEHCVKEVEQETGRINRQFTGTGRLPKRRTGHER